MKLEKLCLTSLASAALAVLAQAQGIGGRMPAEVELEGYANAPVKSYDEFMGRAVLIEFFAYWWGPCGSQVGHLNELQSKFQSKGLSILAVTQEGASETEKWVADKGAKYAYAYDKGGKLSRYFGVGGIPDAVLLDASGKVVWRGHPGSLEEGTITSALTGALPKPLWEWSPAAKGVKSALLKRTFKPALDQAAKLGATDGGPEILAAIQGVVKSSVDGLRSSFEKGDYLGAQSAALNLQKELVGLPEAVEAAKIAADIAADPKALEIVKGQQKLAKITAKEPSKKKEFLAAIDDLQKLKKAYPGTFIEQESERLIRAYETKANG